MPLPAAAAVVGQVVGALGEVTGAIKGFIDSITSFVEAVDPAAVRAMNESLRGLSATIGFAIQPILVGFTQVVRDLAGALMQPMTDLREVVSAVVSDGVALLQPFIAATGDLLRGAVDQLRDFMPAVRAVTASLVGMANMTLVVVRVWQSLSNVFGPLVSPLSQLPDAADAIGRSMVRATVAVVRFTDYVLRAAGLGAIANRVLRDLAREPDKGWPGALQNVQVTDLQSLYRQRIQAAGGAGAGLDLQQQSVDYLREIRDASNKLLESAKAREASGKQQAGWLQQLLRAAFAVPMAAAEAANRRLQRGEEDGDRPPPPNRG